jgi:diguanylate cyclase (GGDEF)-like protein/PAS domain S-box-containing protein
MVEDIPQENPPVVLLADDDEMIRILIRTSLEQSGFLVEEVRDGISALAVFKSLMPDVVLLDVMMPGMNGFEVCREIRKLPEAIYTPILMITGLADIQSIEQAYESGATNFIVKPITLGTLSYHVRYLLRSSQTAEQLHKSKEALSISEERYALAAKGANDGLWDWDLHSGNIYFSERWQSMLGYEHGSFGHTLENWFEHIHKDDLQYVEIALSNHLEGLTDHFEHEHRILHKDQEYRWVLVRGLAIRDTDGKPYRMAGSLTDITSRKKVEKQLIYNALYDNLTGLANRTLFSNRLSHAMQRLKRNQDYLFAIIFLDLDRFKVVNDSLGHRAGDEILKTIAHRLELCIRPGDTASRLAGDEFVILLEGIKDISDAERVVKRIQGKFQEPIQLSHQQIIHTSASIGIVMGSLTYDRPEDLLRDADTAMYRAKSMGIGKYEKFDPSMHHHAVSQLQLENDLRRSLEAQEFIIHYQPIVSLLSGKITSLEALIRWQHPKKGLLQPGDFIGLAEETGLIVPMGEWVLRTVCEQISQWSLLGLNNLRIAVNISSRQLIFEGFVDTVAQILAQTGIDPHILELEITESIVMENLQTAKKILHRLRELGVNLSLDDFGTGYSSLSYLHNFPVSKLKIDRSFMQQVKSNPENKDLVNAIINIAKSLSVDLVAEGVETQDQLKWLQNQKCNLGQGFLFSCPLSALDIEKLLKSKRNYLEKD